MAKKNEAKERAARAALVVEKCRRLTRDAAVAAALEEAREEASRLRTSNADLRDEVFALREKVLGLRGEVATLKELLTEGAKRGQAARHFFSAQRHALDAIAIQFGMVAIDPFAGKSEERGQNGEARCLTTETR